jgi:hypothetical protein
LNTNEGPITFSFPEFDQAVGQCEQSKVSSYADILAGMILCSALTNDDIACDRGLTSVDLYSQTLALRVPTVLYAAFTFFVSHILDLIRLFLITLPKRRLRDLGDADFCVVGTMTMFLAKALPSFHLKGNYFVALYMVDDLSLDNSLHLFPKGQAIAMRKQDFSKFNLITGVARDAGNVQSLIFLDLELLSGYFYDC